MPSDTPLPNPVIVVPGITASSLRDEYPVPPTTVWAELTHKYDKIALHPDNLRYERWNPGSDPLRVLADAVFSIPYRELVEELRHNLTMRADEPVPVFPFAYDWRQPLETTCVQLAEMVNEVIARTRLLPHYFRNNNWMSNPKVDLVGHSMGGLVIVGYLAMTGTNSSVSKVVTIATPYRGSHEAPFKVATGVGMLDDFDGATREREAARMTPALYYLMPDYPGAVDYNKSESGSLFKMDVWQTSVIDTIKEYVRLYGVVKDISESAAYDKAKSILSRMLTLAYEYRRRVSSFRLQECSLTSDNWLCIVGLGAKTRVKTVINSPDGLRPMFDFDDDNRKDDWSSNPGSVDTGDGTVPFEGAVPLFLERNSIVCVSPSDFGYWELGDRALSLRMLAGFHGTLPKMNLLHRMIPNFLMSRPAGKNVWGRRPPGLGPNQEWKPPIVGLKEEPNSD